MITIDLPEPECFLLLKRDESGLHENDDIVERDHNYDPADWGKIARTLYGYGQSLIEGRLGHLDDDGNRKLDIDDTRFNKQELDVITTWLTFNGNPSPIVDHVESTETLTVSAGRHRLKYCWSIYPEIVLPVKNGLFTNLYTNDSTDNFAEYAEKFMWGLSAEAIERNTVFIEKIRDIWGATSR